MTQLLAFYAGKKAFSRIRASGLQPEDVRVVAGAAGGPKWLVLRHLDSVLFGSWLQSRKTPLYLIGSSIGAWRFAAASQEAPLAALQRFQEAYLEQAYGANPSPRAVNHELERILNALMGAQGPGQILANPLLRINIMAVRCKGWLGSDDKARLLPGLGLAAAGNAIYRRSLGLFFERTLFYDPRDLPPFFRLPGFPMHQVPLHADNIKPALMASGSIPLLMPGVDRIPGAPPGVYRDGGIIDYHMNLAYMNPEDGIVLFPHYAEALIPGWLDKQIPWRQPNIANMDPVLLIAPSQAALEQLPYKKIPDRNDFYKFAGRDAERVAYWREVLDMSRKMADEFMEIVTSGRIRERVQPVTDLYGRK